MTELSPTARLDVLAPTVAWLQQQKLLDRAFVYGFDEQPPSMAPAIRQLFGGVKARWPGVRTMAVLNRDANSGGPGGTPGPLGLEIA